MIKLRECQEKGASDIRAALAAGKKAPCFVSPCGSGKTVLFAYITDRSQSKGKRVTIMVHRAELIRQICKALLDREIEYGLCQSGKTEQPNKLTQVASVQTLVRRLDRIPKPDLLIIDECAHATAASYRAILEKWKDVTTLGVTATPSRLSGESLGDVFDTLVMGPTVKELIKLGFLCQPVYYCPPSGVNLSDVHTVAGDYNKAEMIEAMDKPRITGSAVEHYSRLCPNKPAIAFCTSLKHAEHVAVSFREAGFHSEVIEGEMSEQERIAKVRGLGDGRIKVLTSVDLISEGFDLPIVAAAILLRPTQSLSLFIQQAGRAVRPAPGKDKAIILDHVGNVLRHGFLETDREWSLEPGFAKKKKKASAPIPLKQCPKCFAVFPPAPICPLCGFVIPVNGRQVQQVDGTLIELTAQEIETAQQKQDAKETKEREHLEKIARVRGYKPGWVSYILKARREKKNPAPIADTGTIKDWKGEATGT